MPAPAADFILGMMNPYKGFDPNEGAKVAIAAGQLGESRAQRRQHAGEFKLENERANSYLALQQGQFAHKQAQDQREQQIDAFGKFNDALVNGDDEQAAFWAGQLKGSGVGVEEYGGPQAGAPGTQGPKASAMDAYGPYAMSPEQKTAVDSELGITVEEPPEVAPPGATMPEAPSVRPRPARVAGAGMPATPPAESTSAPADAAGSEVNFPSEVGGDKYDPKTGNRIPPGMNEAEAAAIPSANQKGYRITVAGKSIDIRPEDIRRRQEERVRGTLEGLSQGARTPEEKRAAKSAQDAAVKAIPIYGVRGATKVGIDHYEQELERGGALARAKYSAAGRQVSVGFNKDDTLRQAGVFDDVETIVKGFEQNDEVRQARASVANSDRVMGMVKGNNSIAEWAASQSVLKEFVKGVASDRDLAGYLASTGKWAQFEREFNAWFEGGAMPDDIKRKVGELAVETKRFYDKKLAATAQRAHDYTLGNDALRSRVSPRELENHARNVYRRISGRDYPGGGGQKQSDGAPAGKGGKTEAAPTPSKGGPKSSAQQRAEALKKRFGG